MLNLGAIAKLKDRKAQGFGRAIGPLVAEGLVVRKDDGRYTLKPKAAVKKVAPKKTTKAKPKAKTPAKKRTGKPSSMVEETPA